MTINHDLIDKFLDAISPLPENFGLNLFADYSSEWEPINMRDLDAAVKEVDPDARICFGMSKVAIISPNLNDVVIKIPFNGSFYYIDDIQVEWEPFQWAPGSKSDDYCLAEYEKYNKLKAYGLSCFVAKTIFYKTLNGFNIFLQEKVVPMNDVYAIKAPSRKSQKLAKKWYQEGRINIDPTWIASCLDKYGESKVERFLNYCSNIDLDILEDIHEGNFGYREDNTPAILDYSNYNE